MRLSIDEAACEILLTLKQQLPRTSVEYESFGGQHHFYIEHAGVRCNVRIPESALQRKNATDLQPAIQEIVEQLLRITPSPARQFKPMLTLSFMDSVSSALSQRVA